MYVRPISTRLFRGILTPAIRAMASLTLPLLVSRVLADDEDPPVAADDLALLAHRLHRRSYLHGPFRLMIQTGWLWRPRRPPLPIPPTKKSSHGYLAAQSATQENSSPESVLAPMKAALSRRTDRVGHDRVRRRDEYPRSSVDGEHPEP